MELGRLLRDEGITPTMIQQHRSSVVDTMKNALRRELSLAESPLQSYATAPEYHMDDDYPLRATQPRHLSQPSSSPTCFPVSVFGSVPPRTSGFTKAFLKRQSSGTRFDQNVEDGTQSLFQGVSGDKDIAEPRLGDVNFIGWEDWDEHVHHVHRHI